MRRHALTLDEVRDLPAMIDIPTAAAAIGLSASAGRNQVKAGTFPFDVNVVGRLHRVNTAEVHQFLGLKEGLDREEVLRDELDLIKTRAERDEAVAEVARLRKVLAKVRSLVGGES